MIAFRGVAHSVQRHKKTIPILSGTDFDFDLKRMGLVVGREEQSEALIDLMVGNLLPEAGQVLRLGRVSWPIGRLVQFRSELSGRATVDFICGLYGLNLRLAETFLFSLIDFKHYYDQSISKWPRMLNVEFGHAVVLLPDFDIYIAEGSIILGNPEFMERWSPRFEQRLAGRQLIMACNQAAYLSQFCRTVAVLQNGQLNRYSNVAEAMNATTWVAPVSDLSGAGQQERMEDDDGLV